MTLSAALMATMKTIGVEESNGVDKPLMIPTGSMGFNIALGGGLARGRLTTIASAETGYGKTTVVNLLCRAITTAPPETMLNGGTVAIFDQERKLSPEWLKTMGANMNKVKIYHAKSGEALFYAVFNMIMENAFDMIVVDSVKFTSFNSQIEAVNAAKNGFDKAFVAVAASHWSFFCNVVATPLADSNVALVTLNHSSAAVAALFPTADSEYGGKSLPRLASIRLRLVSPTIVDHTDATSGELSTTLTIKANVLKNSFMQRRITGTEIVLVNGILDPIADVVKFGKAFGVFTKKDGSLMAKNGSWFYNGKQVGGSAADVQAYLLAHDDVYKEVYGKVSTLAAGTPLPKDSELFAVEGSDQ